MKCIYDDCRNIAEYNYSYYSKPAYCCKHNKSGMVYKNDHGCKIL